MRNINSEFQIGRIISSGTFGLVFEGMQLSTKRKVVIKKEIGSRQTLKQEKKILKILQGIEGVPKLYWDGIYNGQNYIITEYLNRDFSILKLQNGSFTIKTVIQVAIQLMKILEQIHKRGIVHRDIKPENIMVGGLNQEHIFIIDYGISKLYKIKGSQIPFRRDKCFIGTQKYASLASHQGFEQQPKDDIESVLYFLVELYHGELPWDNQNNLEEICQRKQSISDLKLFKGMPSQLNQIYLYIRKLLYNEQPDHKLIINLLQNILFEQKFVIDNVFDWNNNCKQINLLQTFQQIRKEISNNQNWINDSQVNYQSSEDEEESVQVKYQKFNCKFDFDNPLL